MSIKRIIKAMGGGGGVGYRKPRRPGGGEGGSGGDNNQSPIIDLHEMCKEPHEECPYPSKDSYCNLEENHTGKHKCKSCSESF